MTLARPIALVGSGPVLAIARSLARARRHDPFRPFVRRLRKLPVLGAAARWLESRVHDPGVTWHLPQ